jgi:hypothetical protein
MFDSKRKSFSVNSDLVSTAVAGRPPYYWNCKVERSFQIRLLTRRTWGFLRRICRLGICVSNIEP